MSLACFYFTFSYIQPLSLSLTFLPLFRVRLTKVLFLRAALSGAPLILAETRLAALPRYSSAVQSFLL